MSYVMKLCGWYPSKIDPYSGDFVQRHAKAIATQMPVFAVFAVKAPATRNNDIELEVRKLGNLTEYIYYYPQKAWFDKIWSQWLYLKIIRKFLAQVTKDMGAPLVVHINIAWKAVLWARYIAGKYNWPMVVTENSTEYQPQAILNIRRVGLLRRHLTKWLFQYCKRFITVSKQLGVTVNDLFGTVQVTVVPNAVDTSLFKPAGSRNHSPFRIIHISTLTEQKNPQGLFNVFDKVARDIDNVEIVIIGPNAAWLENWLLAEEYRKAKVTLTGLLPYQEVAVQLQQADLLVLFSHYENLPCVILEAHCCGVPVISSDVGGIKEVVNDSNGILVADNDEENLFNQIESVITGKTVFNRNEIAGNAAEKYNYETIGKLFLAGYKQAGIQITP